MELIPLLLVGPLFAVWTVTALRPADDRQVEAVATMYNVPLSPTVVDRLSARITSLRRWRLVGASLGAVVAAAVGSVGLVESTVNALLFGVAVGYGLASIAAEVVSVRRPRRAQGHAMATARERRVSSILRPLAVVPALIAILLTAVGLAVLIVAPPEADPLGSAAPGVLSGGELVATTITFIAVVAFAGISIRWVALAPERGADMADHVVQRASRLVAIMTIVGATWMTVGVLGSVVWQSLWSSRPSNPPWNWLVGVGAVYLALSGLMGFLSTVTTLPRGRSWGGRSRPSPGPRRSSTTSSTREHPSISERWS